MVVEFGFKEKSRIPSLAVMRLNLGPLFRGAPSTTAMRLEKYPSKFEQV